MQRCKPQSALLDIQTNFSSDTTGTRNRLNEFPRIYRANLYRCLRRGIYNKQMEVFADRLDRKDVGAGGPNAETIATIFSCGILYQIFGGLCGSDETAIQEDVF